MRRFSYVVSITAVCVFIWGVASARLEIFPWSIISPIEKEVREFIQGDVSEKTGLKDKISNDLALRPSRQLYDYENPSDRDYKNFPIEDLRSRRSQPLVYINQQTSPLSGYRLIFGTFDFNSHLHGAILLDPNFNIVNQWVVDEEIITSEIDRWSKTTNNKFRYRSPERRLPQGMVILKDGSLIFNDGDPGNAMVKIDFCGNAQWIQLGKFHHAISYNPDDETIWSFGSKDMMQLSAKTGGGKQSINLNDVHAANPNHNIFNVRRNLYNGRWQADPIHKNDIEPLTSIHSRAYPQFSPGDLLVSHRSSNLTFIFNPETLKIKWWRAGQTRRQHDPDWQSDGSLTIFDNNLRESYNENWDGSLPDGNAGRFSRIIKIDPDTYKASVLYDGAIDNMYSSERAKHQILPNGSILITSAHQGRVLEINEKGDTVFEFSNRYDDKQNLILSEAIWLPLDYFDSDIDKAKSLCNQQL